MLIVLFCVKYRLINVARTYTCLYPCTHAEIVRLLRQVDAQIFTGWGVHKVMESVGV